MKTDALWISFDNGICDLTLFFFTKATRINTIIHFLVIHL